jgi:phage shock protein PspC (stress-responsive transcriptional regulator)
MVDLESGKSGWLGNVLNYVVSIGAVVMGISVYKKLNGDGLSLGDATVLGILIGIVGGLITAIYTYIFMSFIAPEMLDAIKDQAMASAGDMDPDAEDKVSGMMDLMLSPGMMSVMVVIMKFFLGLIVGFIAGLIMKKEKPEGVLDI